MFVVLTLKAWLERIQSSIQTRLSNSADRRHLQWPIAGDLHVRPRLANENAANFWRDMNELSCTKLELRRLKLTNIHFNVALITEVTEMHLTRQLVRQSRQLQDRISGKQSIQLLYWLQDLVHRYAMPKLEPRDCRRVLNPNSFSYWCPSRSSYQKKKDAMACLFSPGSWVWRVFWKPEQ